MYTLVLVFVSLNGLLSVTMGQSAEMHKQMNRMKNITQECLKTNPVQNFQEEITPDGPQSEVGKCFYKCMMTKLGMFDEEGNLEKTRMSKLIDAVCQGREDCAAKHNKSLEECNKVTDESECGVIWKKMQCFKKVIVQVG